MLTALHIAVLILIPWPSPALSPSQLSGAAVMSAFFATPAQLGVVAAKAALMYATALVGLRLGERRTLAQWRVIDFTAAVAIGAIIGRTAVTSDPPYAVGAVALFNIIAMHRIASIARFTQMFTKLVDHRIRLLVVDGRLRRGQLRWCGLTDDDLYAELRLHGITSLTGIRYVLYESKGGLTIVPDAVGQPGELITNGLDGAVDTASGVAT